MSALQGTSKIFTQDITKNLLRFDQSWSRWKLTNGLSCIHVPLPVDDIRLHVGLLVHTGSRWESPEKSGLSHLLEHMMFRGSSLYPSFFELSEAFEGLGGEWNAATGHEYTEYFYSGTVDKEHDAFRLLSDFTLRPALNDLDTEKRIVLRELEGELNEHGVSTDVDFHILRHLWPETSMALPIIGSEGTLEKIKLEDLRAWLARHYVAGNMVLTIVGGDLKKSEELSREFFSAARPSVGKLEVFKSLPNFQGPTWEVIENADNEYDVQISFVCEGTNSPKTPLYDMISRILGDGFSSRLVRRIREELGLVYDISASFQQYDHGGTFNINVNISENNIEIFFTELFLIINQLTLDGPKEAEQQRHLNRSNTDLALLTTDPGSVSYRLAWSILTNADLRLEYWRTEMESVASDQIKAICRELFQPSNMAIVALGPKDAEIDRRFATAIKGYRLK